MNEHSRAERDDMIEVQSLDELPVFANEDEEDEFWANHTLGDRLLAANERAPDGVEAIKALLDGLVVHEVRAIPLFSTAAEASEFWQTHVLSRQAIERAGLPAPDSPAFVDAVTLMRSRLGPPEAGAATTANDGPRGKRRSLRQRNPS